VEAINHIRLKVGKGMLVEQHNSEYGFWRNLGGGSIVAFAVSLADIAVFYIIDHNLAALLISTILALSYLAHIIFAKRLIISSGRDYAKVLIQEYMSNY
jgi:hypothetical protein